MRKRHLRARGAFTRMGLGLLALSLAVGCSSPPPAGPTLKRVLIVTNVNSPYWNAAGQGMQDADNRS